MAGDLEKSIDARLLSPYTSDAVNGDIEPQKPATTMQLVILAMPRMALRAAWGAQWAALGPYLQTMLPSFAVQLAQLIGPVTGVIVEPMVGVFSDRCTSKWGRRRPFLLIAAFLSVVCWTLMGYTREIGDALGDVGTGKEGEVTDRTWTAVFTIAFYFWMDVTCNIVQTPAYLLVSDFAGDRQTLGSAIGQAWATLGSILVAGYIQIFGPAYKTMHWFMGMLSVTMVVSVVAACIVAKEKPLRLKEGAPKQTFWENIRDAFWSIWVGFKTLPGSLVVFAVIFFLNQYGYSAYNSNKGQFFGLEVYGGVSANAGTCGDDCTVDQQNYNKGVKLAGGLADILFNVVGYFFSLLLPFLVRWIGAKWVLTLTALPQALLIVMAFCNIVAVDVVIVALMSISYVTVFVLMVPLAVYERGPGADIGMQVGALIAAYDSGLLLNSAVGVAIVQTDLGYRLPVMVGGIVSLIAFFGSLVFFKVKLYSL